MSHLRFIQDMHEDKTAGLDRDKRVSWGERRIREFSKGSSMCDEIIISQVCEISPQSPNDMDLSVVESFPAMQIVQNPRRPARHLISEFESCGKSGKSENQCKELAVECITKEKENKDAGLYKKPLRKFGAGLNNSFCFAENLYMLLTPVKEESESAHSSGEMMRPRVDNQLSESTRLVHSEPKVGKESGKHTKSEIKSKNTDSSLCLLSSLANTPQINWNFSPRIRYTRKQLPEDNNLANARIKLIESEKELKDLTQIFLELQTKSIKILESSRNSKLDSPICYSKPIDFKQLHSTLMIESFPYQSRWKITYRSKKITYYRHITTSISNPLYSNLSLKLEHEPISTRSILSLIKPLKSSDLNEIFCKCFEQFNSFCPSKTDEEILGIIGKHWNYFVLFCESFDCVLLAFDDILTEYTESEIIIKGKFAETQWNYRFNRISLEHFYDIYNRVMNEILAVM